MAIGSKETPDFSSLKNDLCEIMATRDEPFFAFGSEKLRSDVTEIILLHGLDSIRGKSRDEMFAELGDASFENGDAARWNVLMQAISEITSKTDPSKGNSEEPEDDEEEEPPEEPEGEDDDSAENAANGVIEKITEDFSKKAAIDAFLLKELPNIPILGLLVRGLVGVYNLWSRLWGLFVELLATIADYMDLQNNIIRAIKFVADIAWPFRVFVIFLATTTSYAAWLWLLILLPILRFLWDPIGRTFKFLKKSLKQSGPSEEEGGDEEPIANN